MSPIISPDFSHFFHVPLVLSFLSIELNRFGYVVTREAEQQQSVVQMIQRNKTKLEKTSTDKTKMNTKKGGGEGGRGPAQYKRSLVNIFE